MEELRKLYQDNIVEFKSIVSQFPDDDLAGPLLISPVSSYIRQRKKLMVIGQQTNGWTYHVDNVEEQLTTYQDFSLGKYYYSTPFWNITRKLEAALGNEPYSCVWTNINKFDLEADKPYGEYEKAISKLDYLLLAEIEILQPDVCMFFTGPSFDSRLRTTFPGLEFVQIENWKLNQFCRLKHHSLPEYSFRSYHPKSLRIRYLEENFIEYMTTFQRL